MKISKNQTIGRLLGILLILCLIGMIRWLSQQSTIDRISFPSIVSNQWGQYRRQSCSCTRPILANPLIIDETSASFCSQYATYRGFHQRVIAISIFGPRENSLFDWNTSLAFLHELINDTATVYPGWTLRVYHDTFIGNDIICPIECRYDHVDFCNATGLLGLGNVASYMPPRIWRFLPIGDAYVDIAASRDLDSPLTPRELAATNEWLATNKSWHVMRDHPLHTVPMLAGLWSFRSALNRTFARLLLAKLVNSSLISHYGGKGDQPFLTDHVWPHIQNEVIAHDSHLCMRSYGLNSRPWPTRRPLLNETGCFVGCIRPCCPPIKFPFGECPLACRPKDHPDWTMCWSRPLNVVVARADSFEW